MGSIQRWIKRHKVWTGIIAFVLLSYLLGILGVDLFAVGRLIGLFIGMPYILWLIFRKRNAKKRQNDDKQEINQDYT